MQLLINHSFKYETEQIGLLFFPEHENLEIKSEMAESAGTVTVHTAITNLGKSAEFDFSCKCSCKKDYANCVKRSAFGAARQLSPLNAPWGILTGIRPAKPVRSMLDEGKSEASVLSLLKDTYLVSDKKAALALDIARAEQRLCARDRKQASVYIGIPFCPTRCIYCSFISHDAGKMIKLADKYVENLCIEIKKTAEIIKNLNFKVRNIYFGGGTPTALSAPLLKKLFDAVSENIDMTALEEYTVEAGRPDTITREKLSLIKSCGANRISINPQTKWDKTLKTIGRNHSYADFLSAYSLAREMGFDNINCDIIAGLPGESALEFCETVDALLDLSPENLTVHTLYIKRASGLRTQGIHGGDVCEVEKMIEAAAEKCTAHSLFPYYLYKQKTTLGNLENVGYAKEGFECLYNSDTMSDASTIFALGAGATTKLVLADSIERVFNFKNADDYINKFDEILERKESIYNYFK